MTLLNEQTIACCTPDSPDHTFGGSIEVIQAQFQFPYPRLMRGRLPIQWAEDKSFKVPNRRRSIFKSQSKLQIEQYALFNGATKNMARGDGIERQISWALWVIRVLFHARSRPLATCHMAFTRSACPYLEPQTLNTFCRRAAAEVVWPPQKPQETQGQKHCEPYSSVSVAPISIRTPEPFALSHATMPYYTALASC